MKRLYDWTVRGLAHNNVGYTTKGTVKCEYHELWDIINREMFYQLTKGEAVFGLPGVKCKGPYTVTEVRIVVAGN